MGDMYGFVSEITSYFWCEQRQETEKNLRVYWTREKRKKSGHKSFSNFFLSLA